MGDTPLEYEGHGNWSSNILEEEASHVTSVPDSALTLLAFGVGSGDDLVDFTTPTAPAVKVAGNYTVVISVSTPVSAGKHGLLELQLDSAGANVITEKTLSLDTANGFGGQIRDQIVGNSFIPAGGVIKISAEHDIGAAANVTLSASITRG